MDWTPHGDYIILLPDKEEETSEGGIYIPENCREQLNEGVLIKSGPMCEHGLPDGTRVVFTKHSEYRLKEDTGKVDKKDNKIFDIFIVVQESNIMLYKLASKVEQCLAHTVPEIAGREIK